MFLYWLPFQRRYVHRLSDIPKGVESERIDVPTDTTGLMAYLNDLTQRQDVAHVDPQPDGTVRVVDDVGAEFVGDRKAVIEWLNAGLDEEDVPDREHSDPKPPPPPPIVPDRERPMDAGAILSRIDSPGVNVEGVVEAIGKAKGYALRRYAGAVAVRFQELEKI